MLTITLVVDAPAGQAIGIKEQLAMVCEQFGDTRVVSIVEDAPQQLSINRLYKAGESIEPKRSKGDS